MYVKSLILEQWVLVQDVIEVSDLPVSNRVFVVYWENVKEIEPSEIGLKPHHILDGFIVLRSKEDRAVILVEDIKLHGTLNNTGDRDQERSVRDGVEHVQHMSAVLLLGDWSESVPLCTEDIVVL